jgi:curved DNA-binding protein CbpA
MKDYYYILGLKSNSTADEVKKAYRKLSLKFHPDVNDGDDFFTERFKEIQEAYEVLSNETKRNQYDALNKNRTSKDNNANAGKDYGFNFSPEIEYFRSNKQSFEYDEEVTFSWKTINADKVVIRPFGIVQPIGQKIYRIKDFKNQQITFELTAENSNIGRRTASSLVLINKTYSYLFKHFKEKLENDKFVNNESKAQNKNEKINESKKPSGDLLQLFVINFIVFAIILYLAIYFME